MAAVTGITEINRKLQSLQSRITEPYLRKATTKGMRVIVNGIKSEVPANLKDAKRAIGMSIKKEGDSKISAKAGAGVGKPTKAQNKAAKERAAGNTLKHIGKGGVGISARNIHWFVLGTTDRLQITTGRFTGKMPPQMPNVVKAGTAKSLGQAADAIQKEIWGAVVKHVQKRI